MVSHQYTGAPWEFYIIYLRKSRQDDPNETVEEVLAKHETMLQEFAVKEFGGRIAEENIYREVVSGETIEDRVEMQKVLARIERPDILGVLVIEPQRLSRGDLSDCARVIDSFRFTHTKVITPMMTYNLENKMDRRFFQDELLRGRDYLEYTKEILRRGREAAVKRGCYIAFHPPYGYKKVKIGKDNTLEPIEEEVAIVRYIFELYTKEGLTAGQIATKLNEMSVKSPRGKKWNRSTIGHLLRNKHYIGKVLFYQFKQTVAIEYGERTVKRKAQPDEEVIIAEGKHPAIIDVETFEAAQKRIMNHPRYKSGRNLQNVLGGILKCAGCGRAMYLHKYMHGDDRYECRHNPRCYKSVSAPELNDAILAALEEVELPALELKVANGDGDAVKIQQKLIAKLEKQMSEYRDQEDEQYELLETRKYTQALFDRRNAALRAKMDDCEKQLFKAKAALPKNVDYAERVVALKDAIQMLKDPAASIADKNRILRAIIDRVEFTGSKPQGLARGENSFSIKVFLRV